MINYQRVYHLLSDELDREKINEHALYGYHSMAYSAFMTMKSYYLQNDILSHHEFDSFFEKAGQFSREFTSSRETNHSMQWTFGYYNELVKSYNELASLLGLNPFNVPE
ncbi:hypothetical protein B5V88_16255 [Heyndrickxia sporothermodurans]|uniref:HEPN domain-containing protein n=2 Tax=Heyndrickxia sporothermodurans TaxID=46224 RepID=A0AB37HIJ3_9BACI|nr:hypothetical protein [Heyndrickxia sporothermodurans]MBL5772859.1 hypothetical protein [Heyndrickxia sporothermodurans]MBL5776317.1 hypothetical protein [Heyndrickxia sporothermodurans]MBL5779854.1 hypothetical protein [Heyndrickxia sporothermodurans]MBL5783422.1 hypothetical protein [Heyndrickxia sporothermodurans]